MARIKGATMTHKRRTKTLKLAKGYYCLLYTSDAADEL